MIAIQGTMGEYPMPKYRQLHLKILDSIDVNEMPDDFTRLTWILLSCIVDSAGRGIDNPAWIRARMYPLRNDIDLNTICAALEWFSSRKMIVRYCIDGRKYFHIPTWTLYQTGTDREAPSSIPTPDLLPTYSRPTTFQPTNTIQPIQLAPDGAQPSQLSDEAMLKESIVKNPGAFAALKAHEEDRMKGKADLSWLPESLRPLAQAFITATDIQPLPGERSGWHKSVMDQWEMGILSVTIPKAVKKLRSEGMTIKSPFSVTATARDLQAKKKDDEVWSEVHG
jgi:hypothetical protein